MPMLPPHLFSFLSTHDPHYHKPSLPNTPFFLASNLGSRNPGIQMRWERKWKFCVCAWEKWEKRVRLVCACMCVWTWISNVKTKKRPRGNRQNRERVKHKRNRREREKDTKKIQRFICAICLFYLSMALWALFHILQFYRTVVSMEWWNNYFFLLPGSVLVHISVSLPLPSGPCPFLNNSVKEIPHHVILLFWTLMFMSMFDNNTRWLKSLILLCWY